MSGKSRRCTKCGRNIYAKYSKNMDNIYHTHIMIEHPEDWKRMKALLDKEQRKK